MKQYQDALRSILTEGTWQPNRTGIDTIKSPRPIITQFDLRKGFPALTGRRAPFKSAMGELCGFIRGVTSAADFRALGCKFWDQNANENAQWLANPFRKGEDDLGDVYGAQWRRWPAYKHFTAGTVTDEIYNKLQADGWKFLCSDVGFGNAKETVVYHKLVDQLGDCVRTIITNPNDRRILFHAWNPAKLDEIALPACHLLYQFVPTPATKELALSLVIRSNDYPLGFPSNVMEAAALLHLVARLTGYTPTWLTIISNDAHIYANQMDMVNEYLERPLHDLPKLVISDRVPTIERFSNDLASQGAQAWLTVWKPWYEDSLAKMAIGWLDRVNPTDFTLEGYTPGEPLSAPMAV